MRRQKYLKVLLVVTGVCCGLSEGTIKTVYASEIDTANNSSEIRAGWNEFDGEWYYYHENGEKNFEKLVIDNAVYDFSDNGELEFAHCLEETGGGAYQAGCYDEITQMLFNQMNEEKKYSYFNEHPDREDNNDYDGGMHGLYDRYASYKMDMNLNKAADHRLTKALENGYMEDQIPEEGTINDYLTSISYHGKATYLEVFIRKCEDEQEAFSKILEKTEDKYEVKEDRKYSLEYYRSIGMAHEEKNGEHYFMIIFMR